MGHQFALCKKNCVVGEDIVFHNKLLPATIVMVLAFITPASGTPNWDKTHFSPLAPDGSRAYTTHVLGKHKIIAIGFDGHTFEFYETASVNVRKG